MIIYGINPVLEALRAGRVKEVRVGERGDERLRELLALAAERGVRVAARAGRRARARVARAACIRASSRTSRRRETTASRNWCAAPPVRR